MTLEEWEHHYKEGLCFYCHEKGHSINACLKKKKEDAKKVSKITVDNAKPTARDREGRTDKTKDSMKGFGNSK